MKTQIYTQNASFSPADCRVEEYSDLEQDLQALKDFPKNEIY